MAKKTYGLRLSIDEYNALTHDDTLTVRDAVIALMTQAQQMDAAAPICELPTPKIAPEIDVDQHNRSIHITINLHGA